MAAFGARIGGAKLPRTERGGFALRFYGPGERPAAVINWQSGHSWLYLQITPRGSRSWLLRYMVTGKTHAMGLGPAHLVSLAEAREKAQSAQKELLDGINPQEKKRERKRVQALSKSQMMTFSEGASLNTSMLLLST